MTEHRPVICLGDVMIDVVAALPGPLALGSDVHAPITYVPGGSAANTAAWLAFAGATVTLIGRVGDDAAGTQAHLSLTAAGITDRLRIDWEHPTGTCIVLVNPDGERTMIPDPGANGALGPDDLDLADFVPAAHLHVSGYALIGGARPAAIAAIGAARANGMTISVDAASASPLAAAGADAFCEWIGTDVLLFANRAEAEVLSGAREPEQAALILAERLGRAVVKVGPDGAYYAVGDGQVIHSPAVPLERVRDTTGAGDAFAAGFLAAVTAGRPATDALAEANALAAQAVSLIGGRPARR